MTTDSRSALSGIAGLAAAVSFITVAWLGAASANPKAFVDVKKQGLPAKDCQYCHTTKAPKKETFKPDELNDRGKFLFAEMSKQKLKEPKVEWLKDYPGGPEQK